MKTIFSSYICIFCCFETESDFELVVSPYTSLRNMELDMCHYACYLPGYNMSPVNIKTDC